MQYVLQFIQTKKLLLILDNFEHLLDAAYLIEEIIRPLAKVVLNDGK
jgi:predicted ATPase